MKATSSVGKWDRRNQALLDIEGSLKTENDILNDAFTLLEMCIERLDNASAQNEFALVCCQVTIKAQRYALSSYTVCLDGHYQQAGALLRPLIEGLELLIYFKEDPDRIKYVLPNYQPKKLEAGHVAREIGGTLKQLRDYLNSFASHLSLQPGSWLDKRHFYKKQSLRDAFRILYVTTWTIARCSAECLLTLQQLDDELMDAMDECQAKGLQVFELDKLLQL